MKTKGEWRENPDGTRTWVVKILPPQDVGASEQN